MKLKEKSQPFNRIYEYPFLLTVSVTEGDLTETFSGLEESIDNRWVELASFPFKDDLDGFFVGKLSFIDPLARECIVGIDQGHEPARNGNVVLPKTFWVSRTIPSLVVGVGDLSRKTKKGCISEFLFRSQNGIAA